MAKRVKESVPAEEIVPAEEPVDQAVPVIPVQEPEPEPIHIPSAPGPGSGQKVRRFFGFLFRLILVLIVLGAIAVGLYFGLPLVYQKYIQPVQENTNQLEQLRDRQVQNEQAILDLQTRLMAIETQQAGQAEYLTELGGRVTDIESEIAAHTDSLTSLEKIQATLQEQNDAARAELERQVNLLKTMELLSRARLFMYQSNFGLAKQDVQAARDLLVTVQPDAPESLADDLDAVILRLDLTLSNLPDFPVAASDDLDIAWQILLGGVPQAETVIVETPTPLATLTPTLQATIEPTATP